MRKSSFVLVIIGLLLLSTYAFAQEPATPATPEAAATTTETGAEPSSAEAVGEETPPGPVTPLDTGIGETGNIKGKVTTVGETAERELTAVEGAEIVAKDGDGNEFPKGGPAKANEEGAYEIKDLKPGDYSVRVTAKGYDERLDHVKVKSGITHDHDVRLHKTDTLITYFWKTGPLRWPLLLCSIIALTYIIERLVSLLKMRPRIKVEQLVSRITEALRNDNIMEAVSICEEAGGPLANVVKAGLLRYSQGMIEEREITKEDIAEAIDEASMLEIPQLERNLVVLSTIYQVSPLLGLLGTVIGMVKAFTNIALKGTGDPQTLAGGISEALLTTVIGLIIAIPVMIAYQYFVSRVDRHVLEIQQVSTEIVNALVIGSPQASGE